MKELFNRYYNLIVIFLIALIAIAFFDRTLALALIVLTFLMLITFFVLSKLGLKDKTLIRLLIIALIIHLGAVLFIYYFDFQPFSGGSGGYKYCHIIATELSNNFKKGDFSFEGVPYYEYGKYPYHFYALIIGVFYTVTIPEMIVGQIFQVWLAVLSIIFIYLIVRELGASKKWAFITGLIISFYPSYLFYSSLLLKDGLVMLLASASLLFALKLIKKFSWKYFFIFYLILGLLIYFRMYTGYALLFSFVISWILISKLNSLRKKIIYAIIIIILLGFLPEISVTQGFYGSESFKNFFRPELINFYRKDAYFINWNISDPFIEVENPDDPDNPFIYALDKDKLTRVKGYDSSFIKEEISFKERPYKYLFNEFKYFTYTLFGPFPWQMKKPIHFFALMETIPWYILFLFIIKAVYQSIKKRKKLVFFLVLFSLMALFPIGIFISNFGIITRIRTSAFIALLCLIPLAFKKHY